MIDLLRVQRHLHRANIVGFYGRREIVEGRHYSEKHAYIECNICWNKIQQNKILQHYNEHKNSLNVLKNKTRGTGFEINNIWF